VTGEISIVDSFMSFTTHQVLFRYPIRDDERARHVAHMAEQTYVKGFGGEKKGNGALAILNNA
jgi:hypothetical protein